MERVKLETEGHDARLGQPPLNALMAFVHAVTEARYLAPRPPSWWLTEAVRRQNGQCRYCGKDVCQAPTLDFIIPIAAGGPSTPHAAVLCCKGCKRSRGGQDLLIWKPNASAVLKGLRNDMAREAWNHVTRDSLLMKTQRKAEEVIARRWSLPRFACHAAMIDEGGFIGWRDVASVPCGVPLHLIFKHHAGRLRRAMEPNLSHCTRSAIFWIPTRPAALDAIWDIIEHNGLVRPVKLWTLPPAKNAPEDPSDDWATTMPTMANLVRRRWQQPP